MKILTFVRPRAAPPDTRPGRAPEESFQNEEDEEEVELLLLAMMGITLLSCLTTGSFWDLGQANLLCDHSDCDSCLRT